MYEKEKCIAHNVHDIRHAKLGVALLTMHGACIITVIVTRRKSFLAAKNTQSRANIQVNEID